MTNNLKRVLIFSRPLKDITANPRTVTDHLPQIKDTHMVQIQDILLMANHPHLATMVLLRLKDIHLLLLGLEELRKVIRMGNIILLAAIIHHPHNIIKATVHLLVAMVNIDLHLTQVIRYHLIRDLGHLQVDLRLQASIQVTIKVEVIHRIHKEDLYLRDQVLQVRRLHPNDKKLFNEYAIVLLITKQLYHIQTKTTKRLG